ncbi:hypothetical protein E2562_021339 [Oryza meyeriana var. granulata]|uniref:Uncharacterized protein n=1 Tax=Oryza meyeriana var. granulata TaxID=110450 RepID=A0A6G1BYU9_9ORYZ|nr:hypothetical protein E2562_021339 [Oryza meyeriana var. granulata]
MGMELLTFGEEKGAQTSPSAGESSVGEAFVREGIRRSGIPGGNGVYVLDGELEEARGSDLRRYSLLVWLSNLEQTTYDLPEILPGFIIMHRDLERGWGWQRLVPYSHVQWSDYKRGIAKEAKLVLYLLTRVDSQMHVDYYLCDAIRKSTATVLTILKGEFACQTPGNDDGNDTPDKSEKPLGVITVTDLDCKDSDSMVNFEKGMNGHCEKERSSSLALVI